MQWTHLVQMILASESDYNTALGDGWSNDEMMQNFLIIWRQMDWQKISDISNERWCI